jgi:hypothetical protein
MSDGIRALADSIVTEPMPEVTEPEVPHVDTNGGSAVDQYERLGHGLGRSEREKAGWGPYYEPPVRGAEGVRQLRRICEDILRELDQLKEVMVDGELSDDGGGDAAEILSYLDELYRCPFAEDEGLKKAVVAIQSQVQNAKWTDRHVTFLRKAISLLRVRRIIGDETIDDLYDLMDEQGLDPFRGTISDCEFTKRYRIIEITD